MRLRVYFLKLPRPNKSQVKAVDDLVKSLPALDTQG